MIKFTEHMEYAQQTDQFQGVLAEEDICSFPVLCRTAGGLRQDAMFICFADDPPFLEDGTKTEAGGAQPYAWMKLDARSGKLAFYATRETLDFYLEPGEVPEVPARDPEEGTGSVARLYELYDEIREFAFQSKVTQYGYQVLQEYQTLFWNLAQREWHPYYWSLGKDFFQWIHQILQAGVPQADPLALLNHPGEGGGLLGGFHPPFTEMHFSFGENGDPEGK